MLADLSADQQSRAVSPLAVARAFLAAYAAGDSAAMLALCAQDAEADYVPWGEQGRNPIRTAVGAWVRYPAAFDGFAMPIISAHEDEGARVAVVTTLNRGTQRAAIDGIANAGGEMACPHLFIITLNEDGPICCVQIWCNEVTLYRQLGFPTGFAMDRAG